MAERYTRLFSLPKNLYAESAPVLIAAGALLRDNVTDEVFAQLKLKNIGKQEIRAVTVIVNSFDSAGRPIGNSLHHAYLDLRVRRDGEFGQKNLASLPDKTARFYTVAVTEVVFADGTIWTGADTPWEPLEKQQTLAEYLGDIQLAEQYGIEVDKPYGLAPMEQSGLWFCACGAINRESETVCHLCKSERAKIFGAVNRDILKVKLNARLTRESEKKRRILHVAKRTAIITLSAVAACVACALLITKVIIPSVKYNNAVELMDNGEYESAIAAFETMDGYKDSAEKIEACETAILDEKYDAAVELVDSGEYEEAIAAFEVLNNYKDSAAQIEVCNSAINDEEYALAEGLLNEGKYEDAANAFEAMSGYKDSDKRRQESVYARADELESENMIAQAAFTFGSIPDYKDSYSRSVNLWSKIRSTNSTISAGKSFTAALRSNGTVVAAGSDSSGQLSVSDWTDVVSIATCGARTIALKEDGTVVAAGGRSYYTGDISKWTDIVSIVAHVSVFGLRSDGTVIAEDNDYDIQEWTHIVSVSMGLSYVLGLKADGTVLIAGNDVSNQKEISEWNDIIAVSAYNHTVGLKSDGTVVATGSNEYGKCDVADWHDIVAVSAGGSHTVGLKSDGSVVAVGSNGAGQCDVEEWTDIVSISAGQQYTVGLKSDGTVVATGNNDWGQCDVDGWTDIMVP